MKKLFLALCFATAISSTAISAETTNLSWDQDALPKSIMEFAGHIDIRDPEAVSKALNVQTDLHPYCGYSNCEGRDILGLLHAYPDSAILLPGSKKIGLQYYISRTTLPFENNPEYINTFAALDLFIPKTGYCIRRPDVRLALGKEAFRGSPLNRGEPLDVGLQYQAYRDNNRRTMAEFVFNGPPVENGCLSFVSIREDDYFIGRDKKTQEFNKNYYHGRAVPYHFEWPADLSGSRSIFDPDAGTLPLGMTIEEVLKQHPQCNQQGRGVATEDYRSLTNMPKDGIILFPSYNNTWLASSETVWNTSEHAAHKRPVLDPELLSKYKLHCYIPPGPNDDGAFHFSTIQEYDLLVYEGKVLAVNENISSQIFLPARFLVSEVIAEMPQTQQAIYIWPNSGYQIDAYARDRKYIVLLNITGLSRPRTESTLMPPGVVPIIPRVDYIYIDASAWQHYSQMVNDKLKSMQKGNYAGAEEYCTSVDCLWPTIPPEEAPTPKPVPVARVTIPATTQPLCQSSPVHPCPAPPPIFPPAIPQDVTDNPEAPSGDVLINTMQRFLLNKDLMNYLAFGKELRTESILLQNGYFQGKIDINSPDEYTVGLKPSGKMLALPGFTYTILPKSHGELPPQQYLSSYHEKIVDIEIGTNQTLQKRYCITRDDLIKAFGSNDIKRSGISEHGYDHKFDYEDENGQDIYISADFGGGLPGVGYVSFKCARTLSLTQYHFHKIQ